jgi:UDP-N-acetylglucosamine acyltransferase
MSIAQTARIHPTAVIAPEAELANDVEIGPYAVIEGRVRIGPGCVLRPYVHLCGPLTMGAGNSVYSGAVLGERPQHLRYNNEDTTLDIGDHNIFREHVTVHRGTAQSGTTKIGSHNFFMAGSHIAHDCVVGNRCILANGALVAGHCVLEDNAYLSGNAAIHQFVRVGRLALVGGLSASTMDVPPFVITQGFNCAVAANVIGMRRAGMATAQINAVRRAFEILFRSGLAFPGAASQVEQEVGHVDAVQEMLAFIRNASSRGVNLRTSHARQEAA